MLQTADPASAYEPAAHDSGTDVALGQAKPGGQTTQDNEPFTLA